MATIKRRVVVRSRFFNFETRTSFLSLSLKGTSISFNTCLKFITVISSGRPCFNSSSLFKLFSLFSSHGFAILTYKFRQDCRFIWERISSVNPMLSFVSIDFRYRFHSINYAWKIACVAYILSWHVYLRNPPFVGRFTLKAAKLFTNERMKHITQRAQNL